MTKTNDYNVAHRDLNEIMNKVKDIISAENIRLSSENSKLPVNKKQKKISRIIVPFSLIYTIVSKRDRKGVSIVRTSQLKRVLGIDLDSGNYLKFFYEDIK